MIKFPIYEHEDVGGHQGILLLHRSLIRQGLFHAAHTLFQVMQGKHDANFFCLPVCAITSIMQSIERDNRGNPI